MEFLEEIYTSAPELIEGGASGNLGVVAKSRDFPREIESDLSYQRAYSILEDLPLTDPAAHPARLLMQRVGRDKAILCITQVVFAGADHTGRTAPLAHHLLFAIGSMDREQLTPADIFRQSRDLFYREWRRGPTWIEPSRNLTRTPIERPSMLSWGQFLSEDRLPTVLGMTAQTLLMFAATRRSVVFGLPREATNDIHLLLAEVLALLPPSVQVTLECVSHVVEDSDCPQEAALIFSYPDSTFFRRHAARQDSSAPMILDITNPSTLPLQVTGMFGNRVTAALRQSDAAPHVNALGAEWDALGLQGSQGELFARLLDLRDLLGGVQVDTPWGSLVEETAALSSQSPASAKQIGQWCREMLQRRIANFPTDCRWKTVAAICAEPRWPDGIRQAGMDLVELHATQALPALTSALLINASGGDVLNSDLSRIVSKHPGAVSAAVASAAETGTKEDIAVALRLMELTNSNSLSFIRTWNTSSMTASAEVRSIFLKDFHRRLRTRSLDDSELRELRDNCIYEDGADEQFAFECYLPLLRDTLERGGVADFWKRVATDSVKVAVRVNHIDNHLCYLAQRHKPRLTRDLLQDWISTTRRESGEQAALNLQDAIQAAGLYPILVPQRAVDAPPLPSGIEVRNPFVKNLPVRDEFPPRGGRWVFVFSMLAASILLTIGGLFFFLGDDSLYIGIRKHALLFGFCIGGALIFLIVKTVQFLWLRRASRARWANILNLLGLLVLIGANVVTIWRVLNNVPQTWTIGIQKIEKMFRRESNPAQPRPTNARGRDQ